MATESEPAAGMNPAATGHLPPFVNVSDGPDWWLVGTGIFLVAAVVGIGVFYLKLHALPEHMAHRGQKVQYEIVCVLALLAMFTHNHIFWIIGLLLALVPIPDFTTPMTSIADSLRRIAERADGHALPPPEEEPEPPAPAPVPALEKP